MSGFEDCPLIKRGTFIRRAAFSAAKLLVATSKPSGVGHVLGFDGYRSGMARYPRITFYELRSFIKLTVLFAFWRINGFGLKYLPNFAS